MLSNRSFLSPDDIFLLNPRHEMFLTGADRRLRTTSIANLIILFLVSIIFLVICLVMLISTLQEREVQAQLEQSGISTQAEVISHRQYTSTSSKGGRTTHYYLTYQFKAGNDAQPQNYSREQSVSRDIYNRFQDGAAISIRYLPSDPNTSRLVSSGQSDNNLILIFNGLFLLVPAAIVGSGIWQYRRNRRLEQDGQIIQGRITEATGRRVKGGYRVSIRYAFCPPLSSEIEGKQSQIRNDLRDNLPQPGTPVAVLYVNETLHKVL